MKCLCTVLLCCAIVAASGLGCKRPPQGGNSFNNKSSNNTLPSDSNGEGGDSDALKRTIVDSPSGSAADDRDNDGLTSFQEQMCKTRDDTDDTDGDGVKDAVECATDGDADGVSLSTEKGCGLLDTDQVSFKTKFPDKVALYQATATDAEFVQECVYGNMPLVEGQQMDLALQGAQQAAQAGEVTCGCPAGTATQPCNDCDGDGLSYGTEQACHTQDTGAFTNPNGISDYQLCMGDTGAQAEPITEPRTLTLEYYLAPNTEVLSGILGTYVNADGVEHRGRDEQNLPMPSAGTCPPGHILVGIEACSAKFVEKIEAVFCAPLKPDGKVDIGAKQRLPLGWGGACGGTTILETFVNGTLGGQNIPHTMDCNTGGANDRFVTNISGEYSSSNITKMKFSCGHLNPGFKQNPSKLFLEEEAQETFGGTGIGDLCRSLGTMVSGGGQTVTNVGCRNGYAAVGIAASYTPTDNNTANNVVAGAGAIAVAGCATGLLCPIGIGIAGVSLLVGSTCDISGQLPVVHSFQLVCQKVNVAPVLRTVTEITERCPELPESTTANPNLSVADYPECMAIWGIGAPTPTSTY